MVPATTNLSFIQLQPSGAEGTILPTLYSIDASNGEAQLVCEFVLPTDASATAILAVNADTIVVQAAYPAPTDRSVFAATIGTGATSCGVFDLITLPNDARLRGERRLRGVDPGRQWVSASVNAAGSFAIISVQSPSAPAAIYLSQVVTTATVTPILLLSNAALSALVAPLPLPSREFVSIPSAVAGVALNAYLYTPVDFDPALQYPALMSVEMRLCPFIWCPIGCDCVWQHA
jgi:dipeptidyl aminopeptidase/acylaminoacyl peptidase